MGDRNPNMKDLAPEDLDVYIAHREWMLATVQSKGFGFIQDHIKRMEGLAHKDLVSKFGGIESLASMLEARGALKALRSVIRCAEKIMERGDQAIAERDARGRG